MIIVRVSQHPRSVVSGIAYGGKITAESALGRPACGKGEGLPGSSAGVWIGWDGGIGDGAALQIDCHPCTSAEYTSGLATSIHPVAMFLSIIIGPEFS